MVPQFWVPPPQSSTKNLGRPVVWPITMQLTKEVMEPYFGDIHAAVSSTETQSLPNVIIVQEPDTIMKGAQITEVQIHCLSGSFSGAETF